MAVEYLQYIRGGERGEIVIQLTGGCVAAHFMQGISSENVAYLLRNLADRLEQGVNERSALETFSCLGGCGAKVIAKDAYCSACFRRERQKTRPAHTAAHDCACADCVKAETSPGTCRVCKRMHPDHAPACTYYL